MATSSFLRTVPCLLSLPCSRGTCGLERQTHRGGIFKIKNRKLRSHTEHSEQWMRQNQAHCWGLHVSQGRCCPQGGDLPTAPPETFSCTERLCQLEKLKTEAHVLLHFIIIIFFMPSYAPKTHNQDCAEQEQPQAPLQELRLPRELTGTVLESPILPFPSHYFYDSFLP